MQCTFVESRGGQEGALEKDDTLDDSAQEGEEKEHEIGIAGDLLQEHDLEAEEFPLDELGQISFFDILNHFILYRNI